MSAPSIEFFRGSRLKIFQQFGFGESFWRFEKPPQPQLFGNSRKQLVDRIEADVGEHLVAVGGRVRDVSHQSSRRKIVPLGRLAGNSSYSGIAKSSYSCADIKVLVSS